MIHRKPLVLVADDDASIRTVLNAALSRAGYQVRATGMSSSLWTWISNGDGDVVLTDVVLPDENSFRLIPRIKKLRPTLPVIVMSAQNSFMTAVKAEETGAYAFMPKPFDLKHLLDVVAQALAQPKKGLSSSVSSSQHISEGSRQNVIASTSLVGRSQVMQDVYRLLARVMQTNLPVLLLGETGVGKERVARALHDHGPREASAFVALNLVSIPNEHVEAELFGVEPNPENGTLGKRGRLELADGGTLHLHEVGDMPMSAQMRLVRVLQDGVYSPVGSLTTRKVDVRFVASSTRDLLRLIDLGLFREDLYYRLNVVTINLPPLRARLSDVRDLVDFFVQRSQKSGLGSRQFDSSAIEALCSYAWPGNVRELENFVKRALVTAPQDVVDGGFVRQLLDSRSQIPVLPSENGHNEAVGRLRDLVGREVDLYFDLIDRGQFQDNPKGGALYSHMMDMVEKPLIEATLKHTRGNQIQASDILGINRNTLRKKIKYHRLYSGKASR